MDVDELRSYLDSRSDKVLPVSAFMEMITHFRDKPNHIREILSFAGSKSPIICNNVRGYPITLDDIRELYQRHDDAFYMQYADKLLDKKIEVEAEHSYTFLQIVTTFFFCNYFQTYISLDSESESDILHELYDGFHCTKENDIQELTDALRNGYGDKDRSQQCLRDKYIDLLAQNISAFNALPDILEYCSNHNQDLPSALCEAIMALRRDGYTDAEVMEKISSTFDDDSPSLSEVETIIPEIFMKHRYSRLQGEYFVVMLRKWLQSGQKLQKNDIFDLLFLGSTNTNVDTLEDTELDGSPLLLTFDGELMKFIRDKDIASKKLISRFKEFENEKSSC